MDKRYQTAPCGLDCFNCPAFKENITEETKRITADDRKISPDEVGCRGCRAENGRCYFMKDDCATWTCTQNKGVSYCFECDEFPCGLLAPAAQDAHRPHNMKVYNLCRMKLLGIDGWIEESAHIRDRYYNGKFVVGQGPVLDKDS